MIKDNTEYNIIVLEDNDGDFILLQDYLDDVMTNTEVLHFRTFKDFKAHFTSHIDITDIILLDLNMTDLSGEPLIMEVLKIASNTPIIILTGFTDFPFAKKSLALGASDYLIKEDLNPTVLYKSIIYNIERFKNTIQLKLSKQLYFDLFNKSPLPMCVFDSTTLRFLDVNNAALEQYGCKKEDFLQKKLTDVRLSPDEIEEKTAKLDFIMNLNDHYENIEFHKTKDNQVIVINMSEVPIIYEDTFAKLAALQNITSTLESQYELKLRNERLKKIAWTQSHNVRAPLAKILGIITALEDQSLHEKEKDFLMKSLIKSGGELDEVIDKVIRSTQFLK